MNRVGLLQMPSGISGDMFMGALVDAGAPLPRMEAAVQAVTGDGITLASHEVFRSGIRATKVDVCWKGEVIDESSGPGHHHHHDHPGQSHRFSEIESRIEKADLSNPVRTRALEAFRGLAGAESRIHGVPMNEVHFHELGTLDALADVVGTVAGVEALGLLDRLFHGEVAVGGGTVSTAHGELAVPAPATLALLEGRRCRFEEGRGELTTPTGAALLTTLAREAGTDLHLVPETVGYGGGSRDPKGAPNVARLVLGTASGTAPVNRVAVIEASLDDCTPEEGGHLIGALLEEGALDATLSPLIMKKGRPGFLLRVLAPADRGGEFAERVVVLSTSLGARWRVEERRELERRIDRVRLPEGEVRVKVATLPDGSERAHPEYEDLARIARSRGVPLSVIRGEAERVWNAGA